MTSRLLDRVSFVVNSIDDEKFSHLQANLQEVFAPEVPDVVRVRDAKSMAEGLNRGAREARGEWLVFCHDDIRVMGDPRAVLARAMDQTEVFGPCGTVRVVSGDWYDAGQPYVFGHVVARDRNRQGRFQLQVFGVSEDEIVLGAKALDGIWIACHRSIFDRINGFDECTYTGFVGYDVDFSFRAALIGARVGIVTGLTLFHDSHVGEFSKEKKVAWEQARRTFESTFNPHLSEPGERGHRDIALSSLEDALDVLNSDPLSIQSINDRPDVAKKPVKRERNLLRIMISRINMHVIRILGAK